MSDVAKKKQDKPSEQSPKLTRRERRVQATENILPRAFPQIEAKPEIDHDGWNDEGLTPREEAFVEFLIGKAGGDASKAAEMAGYAAENRNALYATASRTLSRAKVREAIARRLARANLSADWIRQMTAALAASNMGSFLTLDEKGSPTIDWRKAEANGAFVQIRKYKEKGLQAGKVVSIIERSIETHNPAPYLQLLARMQGLVSDKPAASVTVNVHQMSENDLVSIAQRGGDRVASSQESAPFADQLRERDRDPRQAGVE